MDRSSILELAGEFAALGADLHGDGDNEAALHRLVELAVKHVPGCDWASITVIRHGAGKTIAASDPIANEADSLQYALNEGPCLRAATDDANYLLFDVADEPRWPLYAEALLAQTPVRSVLSFQLVAEQNAALNLFADTASAFGDDGIDMGTVFAAHASTAVALYESENESANLGKALESSRQIGAAIGVLMAHYKITEDQAFLLLRTASQGLHIKLREIASDVVATGALPDLPKRQH